MSKAGVRSGDCVEFCFILFFLFNLVFDIYLRFSFYQGVFLFPLMIDSGSGSRACFCESHLLFDSWSWLEKKLKEIDIFEGWWNRIYSPSTVNWSPTTITATQNYCKKVTINSNHTPPSPIWDHSTESLL